MKRRTFYRDGDVLDTIIDEDNKRQLRMVILYAFKHKSEDKTEVFYNLIVEPMEWEDIYDLSICTNFYTLSEEYLKNTTKKVGHIDISSFFPLSGLIFEKGQLK